MALLLAALLSLVTTAGSAGSALRPHVLLVLADDTGWNNLGWHAKSNAAGAEVSTPVLDSLASQGVELDRAITFKCPLWG